MKIEARNKQGKVYYFTEFDQVNHWNYSNWNGYVTVEQVKEACLLGIALIEKNHCPNILNDNSLITGPWSGANDWIASVWMPRAVAAGLKRFAHVVSPNIFSALSAEQLVTKVESMDFEMQIFQTRHEAEKWLQQQVVLEPQLG